MDLIRTEQTYKTITNAKRALKKALTKVGLDIETTRHVIGAVETDGEIRFAPAVLCPSGGDRSWPAIMALPHIGITIIS